MKLALSPTRKPEAPKKGAVPRHRGPTSGHRPRVSLQMSSFNFYGIDPSIGTPFVQTPLRVPFLGYRFEVQYHAKMILQQFDQWIETG
jgi:hypothetical protein